MSVQPAVDTEAQLVLRDAIAKLSDDDQELVKLVYWDGLPINAAATVLSIGEATARKRMQRARKSLRVTLESEDDQITQRA